MTRATLLHVLDRPTALGPAEVRELEQLAQAFPYCQTAHLLLAKAAHDQGTMLAGQRLRRAATYAADRALLRRLIEQVEPAAAPEILAEEHSPKVVVAPLETVETEAETLAPIIISAPAAISPPTAIASLAEAQAVSTIAPSVTPPLPVAEPEAVKNLPTAPAPTLDAALFPIPVAPAAVLPIPIMEASPEVLAPAEAIAAPVPEAAAPVFSAVELPAAAIRAEAEAEQVAADTNLPVFVDQEGIQIPADIPVAEAEPEILEEPLSPAAATAVEPQAEPDLPAQAPAIRPPVEVGEARFEFGLAEKPAPVVPVYELPGLIDEWAAAAVTLSMGGPEALVTAEPEKISVAPALTPAAFTGDAAVGYAFGESSRLGFSMQLLDLLTARAETAESATAVVAAAQPPAVPLPPAGAFFEPDPLLLDHWLTHRPPPPALPSSLDLINNFLKRQPRLTRPAMLPPSPAAQADLSVRSTRAEPDLASETLARILVRQGKPLRAIEIYEKLMVKQPEKKAYFAAQIQSLQPPA